jgi:DNA-binding XRE family transcriptional regulator
MRKKRTVLRLRQLRRAREMTQESLGRKVGLDGGTIAMIESGARKPSFDTAKDLAAEFGVSIEELFSHVEIPA